MKLNKTVVATLPILAVLSVNALANEYYDQQYQEPVNINADITKNKSLSGNVSYLGSNRFLLEKSEYESVTVGFDENTIVIRDKNISTIEDLSNDQNVVVVLTEFDPTREIQQIDNRYSSKTARASAILIRENSDYNIYVGSFKKQGYYEDAALVSESGLVSLPIEDQQIVYNIHGEAIEERLENLSGRTFAVIYSQLSGTDFGIPYSAKIILLEESIEEDTVIMTNVPTPIITPRPPAIPVPDPVVTTIPTPVPEPNISNTFLSFIPWWAGGTLSPTTPPPHLHELPQVDHFALPNLTSNLTSSLTSNLVSTQNLLEEIVEEIIEEVIDESYYTGLEIIIENDEIVIELK